MLSRGRVVGDDAVAFPMQSMSKVFAYGLALEDVIQEKFGDGIMSAIDFKMDIAKEENPKGDRVRITMSGKFLPYGRW